MFKENRIVVILGFGSVSLYFAWGRCDQVTDNSQENSNHHILTKKEYILIDDSYNGCRSIFDRWPCSKSN